DLGEPETVAEYRQSEHGGDAEDGGERDRGGHVIAVGIDHGRDGGDGRVAADRVAGGNEKGHAMVEPEGAADQVAADQGDGGDREHGAEEQWPGASDEGAID